MDPNDPVNQENAALDRMINGIAAAAEYWLPHLIARPMPFWHRSAARDRSAWPSRGLAQFAGPGSRLEQRATAAGRRVTT